MTIGFQISHLLHKTTAMSSHYRCRQDFATVNNFSFSQSIYDHLEYNTWAEGIKAPKNFFANRDSSRKLGPWARRIHRPDSSAAGDFGAVSLPLWKPASPESSPNLSRSQMINNYRQEMMDLVRNLPETSFELSLKDIVELPAALMREEKDASLTEEGGFEESLEMKEKRKATEKRRQRSSSRSDSLDAGGFLLKMLMPIVPGRREAFGRIGTGRRVSQRPMEAAAAAATDGSWSYSGYCERNSSNGSSNNSCDGSRGRKRWKWSACYSFLYRHTGGADPMCANESSLLKRGYRK